MNDYESLKAILKLTGKENEDYKRLFSLIELSKELENKSGDENEDIIKILSIFQPKIKLIHNLLKSQNKQKETNDSFVQYNRPQWKILRII